MILILLLYLNILIHDSCKDGMVHQFLLFFFFFPIAFVEIILHSFFGVWICVFYSFGDKAKKMSIELSLIGMKVFVMISK